MSSVLLEVVWRLAFVPHLNAPLIEFLSLKSTRGEAMYEDIALHNLEERAVREFMSRTSVLWAKVRLQKKKPEFDKLITATETLISSTFTCHWGPAVCVFTAREVIPVSGPSFVCPWQHRKQYDCCCCQYERAKWGFIEEWEISTTLRLEQSMPPNFVNESAQNRGLPEKPEWWFS